MIDIMINVIEKKVTLMIWDTSGRNEQTVLTSLFYQGIKLKPVVAVQFCLLQFLV